MAASQKMWFGLVIASLAVLACVNGQSNEIAPDNTAAVEPLSVANPPPPQPNGAPKDGGAISPPVPAAGQDRHDISGITTESKHPDGSITTVTHFRGNLPQGGHNPFAFPSWNSLPSPYFFPWGPAPHPGFPFQGYPNFPSPPNGNINVKGQPIPPQPAPAPVTAN